MSAQHPRLTTDDPLPVLIRALRGENVTDRLRAAKALGRLGWLAREALPALGRTLNDPDAKVREATASAIGQMGPDALPTLVGMLGHADKYVRRKAVWAMGKLGPLARVALPELCRALKDSDPRTASGAAQAIGNMGADGADGVDPLSEAMRGTNIVLCRLAAKALSQIGTPALATLIAHLQHTDPFVRGESALAIGWMGSAAQPAVPILARIVRGPESSLARTPPPSTFTPPVVPRLPDSATVTPLQLPSADGLSAEINCRIYAAQALGRLGPSAAGALDALHDAASNGPESVQHAAQQAIRQIQNQ